MTSIKQEIIIYLEQNGPQFGGQIEDYIRSIYGAKASNASRRCRELEKAGVLEKELIKLEGVANKVVRYRIVPLSKFAVFVPTKLGNGMHYTHDGLKPEDLHWYQDKNCVCIDCRNQNNIVPTKQEKLI